jgi:hypothetical protein
VRQFSHRVFKLIKIFSNTYLNRKDFFNINITVVIWPGQARMLGAHDLILISNSCMFDKLVHTYEPINCPSSSGKKPWERMQINVRIDCIQEGHNMHAY